MRQTRLVFAILLSLTLALAAACGGDDNDPTTSNTPAGGTSSTASASPAATKASGELILATTTSFQDSGLLDVLTEKFEKDTGYNLTAVAVGSGAAIAQGSRGDADVVFAHSPAAEKKMVEDGDGTERALVMHNDFVLVGPPADPSGVKSAAAVNDAMTALATGKARFISRGDDSGTNVFELNLWKAAAIQPSGQSWYEESGQGMAATLQIASQKGAYTLTDRGTFLAQKANLDLEIVYEGKPQLLNYYHVIVVNPDKHPGVNATAARAFAAFMVSDEVQAIIRTFGVDKYGEPLFYPDAGKPEPT